MYQAKLSSDTPVADPAGDAFGFAGFAKNLAKAVRTTPSPDGLVMAINGPWGAGKTSLLNLVKHDLKTIHEEQCPVIVDFNPWWFNGRDQLASQLLGAMGTKIRSEHPGLLKIGELLAEYSSAISKTVALSTGHPWLDVPVNWFLKRLKRPPKDVPKLKAELAEMLRKGNVRVLVIVDDLDRLTPEEIRELFKVIKALADFPNVIYLLSFAKDVVAHALSTSLNVDGDAYMEKIVQAAFTLPSVDKTRLQRKLFQDLDVLLGALPMAAFDATYWGNVYYDGLHHFISTPRDIVRVTNVLAVTYPPVAGEVNPVDLIALEFLRVFEPKAYEVVRDNRGMFTGAMSEYGHQGDELKQFHEGWLATLSESSREPVKALMTRMFPKVEAVLGNMRYGNDFLGQWRQQLRACSPDIFDLYFQFSIPDDFFSRAELMRLLDLASDKPVFVETLKRATQTIRADGRSKAMDIVDKLTQHEEFQPERAREILEGLFALEQDLLAVADEQRGMLTSLPNSWRLNFLVNRLLEAVRPEARPELLLHLVQSAKALPLTVDTVDRLYESQTNERALRPWMEGIAPETIGELKDAMSTRIRNEPLDTLLAQRDAPSVLFAWSRWTAADEVKAKLAPLLAQEAALLSLLEKFVRTGSTQAWGDRVSRTTYHLDPRALEPFFDLEVLATRVQAMLPNIPAGSDGRRAADKYLAGMVRVRAGQPTDSRRFSDD